jgi:N-hydroxyarylamine O-acetyltransferase
LLKKYQIAQYLGRLNLEYGLNKDTAFLKNIHKTHLFRIPFENLSIHNQEYISLDCEDIFRKIIIKNRGGFCYELNTLFYNLLTSLEYDTTIISARVFNDHGVPGPEFDHMALITETDGQKWLCDVGFGDSFIEPLELTTDKIQNEKWRAYQITRPDKQHFLLSYKDEDIWKKSYLFTLIPRAVDEFNFMCHYHQSSPESHFTQKRLCTIATENGRITLRDNRLIITEGKNKREIPIEGEHTFSEYLYKYFGIDLLFDQMVL